MCYFSQPFPSLSFLFIAYPNCCLLPEASVSVPVPLNRSGKSCLGCCLTVGIVSWMKKRLGFVLVLEGVASENKVHTASGDTGNLEQASQPSSLQLLLVWVWGTMNVPHSALLLQSSCFILPEFSSSCCKVLNRFQSCA